MLLQPEKLFLQLMLSCANAVPEIRAAIAAIDIILFIMASPILLLFINNTIV
jgi:hypothetical protein